MSVIVFYKTPISVVVNAFLGIFSKSFAITPLSVAAHCTHPGSIKRQKNYIKFLLFHYKMVYFSVTTVTPLSPSPYVPRRNSLTLG